MLPTMGPQRRNRIIFMGYRRGLTPPKYPEPTVKPENRVTLLEAIGDLITDVKKKKSVNPAPSQYQLDSINGRTPGIDGKPIAAKLLPVQSFQGRRIL